MQVSLVSFSNTCNSQVIIVETRKSEDRKLSQATDLVKRVNKALETKDIKTYRSLLHSDYRFRGPMMELNDPDEAAAVMEACPFTYRNENAVYVNEDERVVVVFDWVVTAPVKFSIHVVEYWSVNDGKVLASELFFDTAKFPAEAMEILASMEKTSCHAV